MIDKIYGSVATYKTREALYVIQKLARGFKPNSKVLILGAGCGAETILIKKECPTCLVTAIDSWNGDIEYNDGKTSIPGTNFQDDFNSSCRLFNVEVDRAIKSNIYKTRVIEEIGDDWDFIYYDCVDNGDGKSLDLVLNMLIRLWGKLNASGTLMGDDYVFDRPDYKMSPVVDKFVDEIAGIQSFEVDRFNKSYHWMIRK